jgi:DNA-binding NarL/FixJ family response regulator
MLGRRLWLLVGGAGALCVVLALLDQWLGGEPFVASDFAFDVFEQAVLLAAVAAVAWVVIEVRGLRGEQAELRRDIDRAVAMGREWREASHAELADLSAAIGRQFETWGLTPAEADIAGLMLKGVPLRDIALLRRTSETTIRQQAHAIYRKSGLAGRAELSAYFLESLFDVREAGRSG